MGRKTIRIVVEKEGNEELGKRIKIITEMDQEFAIMRYKKSNDIETKQHNMKQYVHSLIFKTKTSLYKKHF